MRSDKQGHSTWSPPSQTDGIDLGLVGLQSHSQPCLFEGSTKEPKLLPRAAAPIDGVHSYEQPEYDPWARKTVLSFGIWLLKRSRYRALITCRWWRDTRAL